MTLDQAIARIIDREGATFTDDAQDTPTKYGVTIAAYTEWRASLGELPAPGEDWVYRVRQLTLDQAIAFYRWYLRPFATLTMLGPREWDELLDCAVLHGRVGAVKLMQRAIGADVDGSVGPQTRTLLSHLPPGVFLYRLALGRIELMVGDVRRDIVTRYGAAAFTSTDLKYLRGWLYRTVRVAWGPA